MNSLELRDMARAVVKDRSASRERQRVAYELIELVDSVRALSESADAPRRTREKAARFLSHLESKTEELGHRILGEAYLLNCVGEAMVLERYVGQPVLDFLGKGLYFYGLDHIERFQRARAVRYLAAHADLLVEYTSRDSVKALLGYGEERMRSGRPFCLVHHYLNALRRRYWSEARASEDACDVAVTLDTADDDSGREEHEYNTQAASEAQASDRVQLILGVFRDHLTPLQQRVYAARHQVQDIDLEPELAKLFAAEEHRWVDIAARHGSTEKTVKREYVRALHTLLKESSSLVFGETIPSSFVRRVLQTLQTIMQTRDLRMKDNAGRGMGRIVERWQVALRFVLNHGRDVPEQVHEELEGEVG